MKWRLALASKDGKSVNVHFGLANHFLIFEISDLSGECRYVEDRKTTPACLATCCSHGNEAESFAAIASELNDVQAIFVSKIGEGAATFMESRGKAVYESPFPIEPLLGKIVNDKVYLTDKWQYPTNH